MLCVTPLWAVGWRFRLLEGFCGRLPVAAWFLLWVAVLFELCWRAQWASIPAGLRARGSRRRRLTVVGVNTGAAFIVCGNRELASARRYGHPLRQRVGQRGAGQSGLPCWLTNLVRKSVGWLWRQAGANSRLPQSWLTIVVLTPAEVACHYLEPRARRPGATDARRASTGGGVLGEHSGRPYRLAYALAVRGVGGLPWLALTPVLLSSSVATANWLQPASMATHCAGEWVGSRQGSPDVQVSAPTLFASSSGGCGDRMEPIRGCHRVG